MSQPESLRLADAWDQAISTRRHVSIGCEMADELRRLHAENETLLSAVSEAVAAEREACKAIAVSEQKTMRGIALNHPDGSASRDRLFARARSAESIAQAIGARGAT